MAPDPRFFAPTPTVLAKKQTLVFQYPKCDAPRDMLRLEVSRKIVEQEDIKKLFPSESVLFKTFHLFLRKGYIGAVLFQDTEWVSYGWMLPPCAEPTPDLPHWVRHLDAYWIFNCHTREKYRGRGLYKSLLQFLLQTAFARTREGAPRIYIDTSCKNIPSRRAILSAGFAPRGIIKYYKIPFHSYLHYYRFVFPGLMRIRGAKWAREQIHPPL